MVRRASPRSKSLVAGERVVVGFDGGWIETWWSRKSWKLAGRQIWVAGRCSWVWTGLAWPWLGKNEGNCLTLL